MDTYLFESLDDTFNTEEDCVRFLMKRRWASGFCCPNCDYHLFYIVKTRNLLECKECRTQISLTAGTVMHKSKLSLMLWFKAIRVLIQDRQTYSITAFAGLLGVNYRTSKLMLEKLQLALYKQYSRMGSSADRKRKQKVESSQNKRKHTTFNSRKINTNFYTFMFTNSKSIKYVEDVLFRKWMDAFLSVYLFPVFLRYYQVL
ncbi:transposase-like protein [Paenibacillus sp. V4I9]|uniref:IS1595 family transposase n=1 Tax=Paenibacillus sp. V4I9 TaxID=3042308 RepID=UPI00278004D7|nr:IS1595 family transposase [Paenibacillus sp. V4I9]MDQ0890634.1 transposase-like protein [Paenibacillus sp. V4I9]